MGRGRQDATIENWNYMVTHSLRGDQPNGQGDT